MEAMSEHTIPFSGLKDGLHEFDFALGAPFFKATGVEEYEGGKVKAHVELDKSEHLLVTKIHLNGHVVVACDHCNAPMQQKVKGDQRQIFKTTDEPDIEDEELVGLGPKAHEINLTHYFFECLTLHMPIRHVHPKGKCDPEVDGAFEKIKVEHEPVPDPRWDALKVLKNKKR